MTPRSIAMTLLSVCSVVLTCTAVQMLPTVAADTKPPDSCAAAPLHQFDFWLGDWDVRTADGKLVGRNRITREELACVLMERWQSAGGSTGVSMNYYDPTTERWTQQWVSNGVILTMTGGLRGKEMVLEGPMHYTADKRVTILRGTWTPLDDGRLRQHFVESADGGKTWTEWFDGYYSRRQPSRKVSSLTGLVTPL